MDITAEQRETVVTGITLLNLAKNKKSIDQAMVYMHKRGYSDEASYDSIKKFLINEGIEVEPFKLADSWEYFSLGLQCVKPTPFWLRIIKGAAVGVVKSLPNGLDISDLPVIIEGIYQELKKK